MNQQVHKTKMTPLGVTWAGAVVDLVLSIAKIAAGMFSGSQAILADGMHSASDLITDFAVLAGLRVSNIPADRKHPYGHRRVTTLVAMFVGATLLAAGGWMAFNAIRNVMHPIKSIQPGLPFIVAALAVPVKELLYQVTVHVGRRESDLSLLANAWHHRSDAMTSVAAAAGLAGVMIGGAQWCILDALTALVLSAFLVVVAAKIISTSASELMDRAPGAETISVIERAVSKTDGVITFHAFRARQVGGRVDMDVHVQVDPHLTVAQGHQIASAVRHAVIEADDNVIACTVHVEPAEHNDGPK